MTQTPAEPDQTRAQSSTHHAVTAERATQLPPKRSLVDDLPGIVPPAVPTAALAGLLLAYFFGVSLVTASVIAFLLLALEWIRTLFATAHRANANAYSEISAHLDYLRTRLAELQVAQAPSDRSRALERASSALDQADQLIRERGPQWTTGSGYVQLWQVAHRAEEALLTAESNEAVAQRGLYEERRLVGAAIENADELLNQVRRAVVTLDPSAGRYLAQQPPADPPAAGEQTGIPRG